jgi:hypothetical protein
MEFARQVQTWLFPQKLPAMQTLEYTGRCVPARTVGGDYYDFLELRPGRLALVLADIAGKGVPGAFLMANLQANLRSQYAAAVDDLPGLLASVNRLFFQTTGRRSLSICRAVSGTISSTAESGPAPKPCCRLVPCRPAASPIALSNRKPPPAPESNVHQNRPAPLTRTDISGPYPARTLAARV